MSKIYQFLIPLALLIPPTLHANDLKTSEGDKLLSSPRAVVWKKDVEAFLERMPEADRVNFLLNGKQVNSLLENLYVNRVLANEARGMKMDADPLVARQLEQQADQLLTRARLKKMEKETVYPDFEARALEMYKIEPERFMVPAEVHAMHILIGLKERDRDEAIKRAGEVRAKVVANEKKFEDLALEYSDDPSAKENKGDLGFFAANRMVKPFAEAAFALGEPGAISEPVETKFGFHIIKLIAKKEGYKKPFESVKAELIKGQKVEFFENKQREYISAIKADKDLKTNTDAILGLKPKIIKAEDLPKEDAKQP